MGAGQSLAEGGLLRPGVRGIAAGYFIMGDPDDCVRELRRYIDALGVNCFIFRIQWPGMEEIIVLRTIALLAEHVMPALQRRHRR